jgi:hypothetical protein
MTNEDINFTTLYILITIVTVILSSQISSFQKDMNRRFDVIDQRIHMREDRIIDSVKENKIK